MAAFSHTACFLLWAALLVSCATAAPAPVAEGDLAHSQALDYHNEAGTSRCYYNFQHYEEGDRIVTNEPCLNCTCHKRMLMCYLRVCPFTKAVGQDCTVEKKPDQCCPVITCPEVPVDILTSSTTESTTSTAVGHVNQYGCTLEDNTFYPDGVQMPSDPRKPCELCYCIRNHTACVRQECTLNVEGCKPVYQEGVCCPVRYDCDYSEIGTTEKPSTGGLILGSTSSPLQCRYGDILYNDGELIETDKPCESCYCMRGDIVCAVRSCGEPMEGKDCQALPPQEGQCCPTTYQCANGTVSIEGPTESSIIMHPSSPSELQTEGPTKLPESGEPVEEAIAAESEVHTLDEKKETEVPSEVAPSDSPSEEVEEPEKATEDKNEQTSEVGEPVESDPVEDEGSEQEEVSSNHITPEGDHLVTESPNDIHEHLSTSGPMLSSNQEEESSSSPSTEQAIPEETTSEQNSEVESDQKQSEQIVPEIVTEPHLSEGETKPIAVSENEQKEGEKVTDSDEIVPEEEGVTEVNHEEESSKDKIDDSVPNDTEAVTETVHTAGEEHDHAITDDKKDQLIPTADKENQEDVKVESSDSEKTSSDNKDENKEETPNSSDKEISVVEETSEEAVSEHKPESETSLENNVVFGETPAKTPESLDQVKEDVDQDEKSGTESSNVHDVEVSEVSPSVSENVPDVSHDEVETESKPEDLPRPSEEEDKVVPTEDSESSQVPAEQQNPEESFPKEPVPPRKEDAAPEEPEQRPQHPEGSMTKAEDSVPTDQTVPLETEVPDKLEESEISQESTSPDDPESKPLETIGNNVVHEVSQENKPEDQQEVTESSGIQTDQSSPEEDLPGHTEEPIKISNEGESSVPESPQVIITDEQTVPSLINDEIESGSATEEVKPVETPEEEQDVHSSLSEDNEGGAVPNIVITETEAESVTSSEEISDHKSTAQNTPESGPGSNGENEESNVILQTENPEESPKEPSELESEVQSGDQIQPSPETITDDETASPQTTQASSDVSISENSEDKDQHDVSSDQTQASTDIESSTEVVDHLGPTKDQASEVPEKTEEEEATPSKEVMTEERPSSENDESSAAEQDKTEEIHKDEADSEEIANEINPEQPVESDHDHSVNEVQTELPITQESSTDTLIKAGGESKPEVSENEKEGEDTTQETKPSETVEIHQAPEEAVTEKQTEEEHQIPVESDPTDIEEPEFEPTDDDEDDHEIPSGNEIVIDEHHGGPQGELINEIPPELKPGGVIPGEGDCLVDGQTYANNSKVPSKSTCHKECTCQSSIVHCQGIDCPPPPPELANCMPVHQNDLCCPVYTCDGNMPESPESHNHMGITDGNIVGNEEHSSTEGNLESEGQPHEGDVSIEQPNPTDESVPESGADTPTKTETENEPHIEENSQQGATEEVTETQNVVDKGETINSDQISAGDDMTENHEVETSVSTEENAPNVDEVKPDSNASDLQSGDNNQSEQTTETIEHADDTAASVTEQPTSEKDTDLELNSQVPLEGETPEGQTAHAEESEPAAAEEESNTNISHNGEETETQTAISTDESEIHEVEPANSQPAGTDSIVEDTSVKPEETNELPEPRPTEYVETPQKPEADDTEVSPSAGDTEKIEENEPENTSEDALNNGHTEVPSIQSSESEKPLSLENGNVEESDSVSKPVEQASEQETQTSPEETSPSSGDEEQSISEEVHHSEESVTSTETGDKPVESTGVDTISTPTSDGTETSEDGNDHEVPVTEVNEVGEVEASATEETSSNMDHLSTESSESNPDIHRPEEVENEVSMPESDKPEDESEDVPQKPQETGQINPSEESDITSEQKPIEEQSSENSPIPETIAEEGGTETSQITESVTENSEGGIKHEDSDTLKPHAENDPEVDVTHGEEGSTLGESHDTEVTETETEISHTEDESSTENVEENPHSSQTDKVSETDTIPEKEHEDTSMTSENVPEDSNSDITPTPIHINESPMESTVGFDPSLSTKEPTQAAELSTEGHIDSTPGPDNGDQSISTEGYSDKGKYPESDSLNKDESPQEHEEQSVDLTDTNKTTPEITSQPEVYSSESDTLESDKHVVDDSEETTENVEQPAQTSEGSSPESDLAVHEPDHPETDEIHSTQEVEEAVHEVSTDVPKLEGSDHIEPTTHDDTQPSPVEGAPNEEEESSSSGINETGPIHEEEVHSEETPVQGEEETVHEDKEPTKEEAVVSSGDGETPHEDMDHDNEAENSVHEPQTPLQEGDQSSNDSGHPAQEPSHTYQEDEHTVQEPEQIIHETQEGSHPLIETQDSSAAQSPVEETPLGAGETKPIPSTPDDGDLHTDEHFPTDVDMDYDVSEDGAFGPGTCRYGGKVYVSAQQIPRDDPCDFCFCFRSDIICLQQSCPPPIHRCHQEPIQGYCCPRYQCPVSMATSLNLTTTTTTTTTTLPPHFFAHAYHGQARQAGCLHRGRAYGVGDVIDTASGPCMECTCGSDGQMLCDPKVCSPEPTLRKLMEAAVNHRKR